MIRRLRRPYLAISHSWSAQQSFGGPFERSCHVLAHRPCALLGPQPLATAPAHFSAHAAVQQQPLIQHQANYGFAAAALVQQTQAALPDAQAVPALIQKAQSPAPETQAVPALVQQASDSASPQAQAVPDADLYRVRVVTGNLRGAGTPSVASLQLIGTVGISQKVTVGTDELGTLDRGSVRSVDILVPKHSIGTLRRVHVEKRMAAHISGDGWYLKHIEVATPEGERTLFPCEAWLGESDCGSYAGPQERNLLPAVPGLAEAMELHAMPVKLTCSGMAIPHPEKVLKSKMKGYNVRGFGYGGEDAYYTIDNGKGLFSMGVADGVYMWREQGIDSGLMSRSIMESCRQQVAMGEDDVVKLLNRAVEHTFAANVSGSATVCILTVNQNTGQLHSANLGDSGFMVFAPSHGMSYDLKFRTDQLEHSFGCPFQIGHHESANKVEDSDFATFHVLPGDIIVMGSDGLLDNVADLDMSRELAELVRLGASASQMSQHLTKMAFEASMDKSRVTPYSKGASEAFDMVYSGGKPDDITVLVAVCQ